MLTLSSITPRDSHELWFGSSQPYRSASDQQTGDNSAANHLARRNASAAEERSLRARKLNIATFGYSWIRPAGCAKTMLGMKEEEAEREEALQAAAAEMEAAEGAGIMDDDMGMQGGEVEEDEGMERDLDDDIPNAEEEEEEASGLIEEGEEGLEEDDIGDEGEYMERDLDDDIPEGFPDDDYEGSGLYDDDDDDDDEDDFNNQPDLDADIPADDGESVSEGMTRDLDDDIPDAAEQGSEQEGEWQHTDSEEELSDEEEENEPSIIQTRFAENFRTSTPNSRGGLPPPPTLRREPETEAQRRFSTAGAVVAMRLTLAACFTAMKTCVHP
ncbi:Anaphase-promoting complex subunit 15/MND2 [Penicillium expansum]|nr:Anaphase-promoting complex subunit 15/MND2 [Penicillium expansum]